MRPVFLLLILVTGVLSTTHAKADAPANDAAACYRCEARGINGLSGEYTSPVFSLAERGALISCERSRGVECRIQHCFREPLEMCGIGRPRAFRCEAVGYNRERRPVYAEDTDNSSEMAARMAVAKCEHEGGLNCRVLHCFRL